MVAHCEGNRPRSSMSRRPGGARLSSGSFSTEGITGRGATMMNLDPALNDTRRVVDEPYARTGLAIVRLTIGAMFVWVFFENLGKGAYTPAGYAGLINYYIKSSHSPAACRSEEHTSELQSPHHLAC